MREGEMDKETLTLLDQIKTWHEEAEVAKSIWIGKAIAIGEALLVIQQRTGVGGWTDFVRDSLPFAWQTANAYMRVATHQKLLVASGVKSKNETMAATVGLPARKVNTSKATPQLKKFVKTQRAEGESFQAIGRTLGVPGTTVRRWVDPKYAQKIRQRNAAMYAKKAQQRREIEMAKQNLEREKLAKQMRGRGNIPLAYSNLRKALQSLDAELADASPEYRVALSTAIAAGHRFEDMLVQAMKTKTLVAA